MPYAVLSSLVNFGIYLHNADIDRTVRRAIEHRFEKRSDTPGVEVLLATSTLSYGVNLAVDAVVLIQPQFPFQMRDGDRERFIVRTRVSEHARACGTLWQELWRQCLYHL